MILTGEWIRVEQTKKKSPINQAKNVSKSTKPVKLTNRIKSDTLSPSHLVQLSLLPDKQSGKQIIFLFMKHYKIFC